MTSSNYCWFRPSLSLLLGALMFAGLGCSEEKKVEKAPAKERLVSVMAIPTAARHQGAFDGAIIEASRDMLRIDKEDVFALEKGRIPKAKKQGHLVEALVTKLRGKPSAALRVHATTPYETTLALIASARKAGVERVGFEVRPINVASSAFLLLLKPEVVSGETALASLPWDHFTEKWQSMYEECRNGTYVDCNASLKEPKKGGDAEIRLYARGQAVQIEIRRSEVEEEKKAGGGGQLLDGIAAPEPSAAEVPPEEELDLIAASFTWRVGESTKEDSVIDETIRPLCGKGCKVRVVADPETATMNLVSLIGAAFPNGSTEPQIEFQIAKKGQ